MRNFLTFLKFNNTVPIAFTIIMVGAGSAYAANNPEVIIDRTEQVISIDNSYIADIDLDSYSPTVRILKVEEDDTYYYVTYSLSTIELVEAVWQDVVFEDTIRIEKNGLGPYRDLGMYVTDQLNQLIDAELRRLKETQVIERAQRSQKKIAVAYSGLVGGFLSEKVETIKGYKPVVVPPKPKAEKQTFARPDPNALKEKPKPAPILEEPLPEIVEPEVETPVEGEELPVEEIPNTAPEVTLLGEAVVTLEMGASYVDLGATVIDDHDTPPLELYLNDVLVEAIILDTSVAGSYTITYFAEDTQGLTGGATRTVTVGDSTATSTPDSEEEVATTTPSTPTEEESDSSEEEEEGDVPEEVPPSVPPVLNEAVDETESIESTDESNVSASGSSSS